MSAGSNMRLNGLKPAEGSKHPAKRVGRGIDQSAATGLQDHQHND